MSSRSGPVGLLRNLFVVVAVAGSVVLAPVAVIGSWARAELVDTDRFVNTFAPIIDEPAVQSFVTDQVAGQINSNIDIEGTVSSLFEGLQTLPIPQSAANSLSTLEVPAVLGIRAMIQEATGQVVASPQFAAVWRTVLEQTHSGMVVLMTADPAALKLSDDGMISLEVGPIVEAVKQTLESEGFGLASTIPAVTKSVPLVTGDAIVLVRSLYQIASKVGFWLPVLVVALLGMGIGLARNRLRVAAWAAAGLAFSFLLLALGIGVGRSFVVRSISPSLMPRDTAQALYGVVTSQTSTWSAVLAVVCGVVSAVAWYRLRQQSDAIEVDLSVKG